MSESLFDAYPSCALLTSELIHPLLTSYLYYKTNYHKFFILSKKKEKVKSISPSGTRTRAFRVKAEYPSHLDQWGAYIGLGFIL